MSSAATWAPESGRPLAPLTSLGLGGPARYFAAIDRRELLIEALAWAERTEVRVGVLGGGSNLLVSDAGFDGLVLHMQTRGMTLERDPAGPARLTVQAGEPWQNVVDFCLAEELAGVECLTGIPGSSGATPIQNVGAYGQEVGEVVEAVELLDRADGSVRWWSRADCAFSYRSSRFKREPERYVVLAVRLGLRPHGEASVRYPELARALGVREAVPSLREVAAVVRDLRASKAMLLENAAENGRSAGSFFTNPIVTNFVAAQLRVQAVARGIVTREDQVPCFDAGPEHKKLAAAWLIEHAGIAKGLRRGAVGISSKHTLALVHHGGGTTRELLALAAEVQRRVQESFGISLELEPVRW